MKVNGIGNDIIEIERIRRSVEEHGDRFLARIFTQKELDYCLKHKDPIPHLAGRFAAKEAVAKALGTGFGEQLSWKDIEILNDAAGKPLVHLHAMEEKRSVLLSISHCRDYVTAVALLISSI